MLRIPFFINLLAIVVLIGIAYLVTFYSGPIRKTIVTTKTAVAGVSTSSAELETSFPSELQKDAERHIETVKKQFLDVKVGEIFSFVSRAGKIIDDFHNLQEDVQKTLESKEK